MANKLDKPPDAAEPVNCNDDKNESSTVTGNSHSSTCNCTKISVMLLIHEMKQQYATVPDHIVSQCVMDNCHNRTALINILEREAEKYPGSVQAYPQALRNSKRSLTPRRSAPPVPNSSDKLELTSRKFSKASSRNNDVNTTSGESSSCDTPTSDDTERKFTVRPNTLNLIHLPNDNSSSACSRPIRPAPPPPVSSLSSSSSTSSLLANNCTSASVFHQATATTTTPDLNESLNVSLNVMVSPMSSGRPPVRPPRHTTAISVNPESGFPQLDSMHNPRSYTSVNFTLRQPGDEPQSPIEITAGPSLTYSSRSYDARAGFQRHLAITVGGGGGSISAARMRPRAIGYASLTENISSGTVSSNISSGLHSLPKITARATTTTTLTTLNKANVVDRQLLCKERLFFELENEKKHLQVMLREISVLQSPIPPDGCTTLLDEIERLRRNCRQMAQEVEEACPSTALGETNEAFYQNIYTGQRLPMQQSRSQRPPRPPPPYVLRCLSGQQRHQQQQQQGQSDYVLDEPNENIDGGQPWTCNMCTFQNHPLLNKCEQCEMPLLATSGTVNNNSENTMQPSYLTSRLQHHIPYQQSVASVVQNPMSYNSSGFNDLPPRLTQQH